MEKILVATDGSENAERALLEAKRIAQALNAEVDIINVMEYIVLSPYSTVKYPAMPVDKHSKEIAEKVLEEALKLFDDFEGKVNTITEKGDPGDAIIEAAEKKDYYLILMGSRGLGTFSKAILGSASNKVVNHVNTNVLIVR